MPMYEYKCACGHTFTLMMGFSEKKPVHPKCESCGGKKTERVLSSPTFKFKGDGWATRNGYRG